MLPKKKRLSKQDFRGLRPEKVLRGAFFDIAFTPKEISKYACVIAKKQIKRAVDRNAVKRKIYASISTTDTQKTGFFIIYPKKTALTMARNKVCEEINKMFATLG